MKGIIFVFFAAVICFSFSTNHGDPSFTKSFDTDGAVTLQLSTSGGSIEVVEHEGHKVEVDFFVRKSGKLQSCSYDQLKELKEVIIQQDENDIRINVKNNKGSSRTSVSFLARVPASTSATIATAGGSLRLEGLTGNQRLATSGGSIDIHDIKGDVDAATSGGSISGINLSGKVQVTTSGGTIKINSLTGSLKAATSGGSIVLKDISGPANASTSGGSISANLTTWTGDLILSTSGGSIKVDIPDDATAQVNLKGNSVSLSLDGFNGEVKRSRIEGSLNGGGYKLSCKTSAGSVKVH